MVVPPIFGADITVDLSKKNSIFQSFYNEKPMPLV